MSILTAVSRREGSSLCVLLYLFSEPDYIDKPINNSIDHGSLYF